jgi:hypothetical protein
LKIEVDGERDETGTAPRPLSRMAAPALPELKVEQRNGVRVGISTPVTVDDDDDEVKSYNAYLAKLNARAETAAGGRTRRT